MEVERHAEEKSLPGGEALSKKASSIHIAQRRNPTQSDRQDILKYGTRIKNSYFKNSQFKEDEHTHSTVGPTFGY